MNSAGQKANAAVFGDPDVSYDGNRVSFGVGDATNLFAATPTTASDVVVRDVAAGTTVLAAQSTAGVLANGTTERSAISADGRVGGLRGSGGHLQPRARRHGPGQRRHRAQPAAGTTTAASDPTADHRLGLPRHLRRRPLRGLRDRREVRPGQRRQRRQRRLPARHDHRRASPWCRRADGARHGRRRRAAIRPAISADGSRVSFTSPSTDLTGGDGNARGRRLRARHRPRKVTARASSRPTAPPRATPTRRASAIGGAGSLVAFVTIDARGATRLVPTDTNTQPDVLAKELAPTDTTGPAIQLTSQRRPRAASPSPSPRPTPRASAP